MYELIFEGTEDNTPDTLRRVKGAFISDLNFSVEEVKNILDNAPLMILRAKSESELQSLYLTLQKAGGKVAIVRPSSEDSHDQENADGFEFTIEFDEDSEETAILEPSQPQKDPPVYALDFNPDEENQDLKENANEPHDTEVKDDLVVDSDSSDELEFDLQVSEQPAATEESEKSDESEATGSSDNEGLEFKLSFDDSLEVNQSEPSSPKESMEDEPALLKVEDDEDLEQSGALSFIIDDSQPEQPEQPKDRSGEASLSANELKPSDDLEYEESLNAVIESAFAEDLDLDSDELSTDPTPEEQANADQTKTSTVKSQTAPTAKKAPESKAPSPVASTKTGNRPEPPGIAAKIKHESIDQSSIAESSKETRNFSTLGAAGLVMVLILVVGNTFLLYENLFGNRGNTGIQQETIESIVSSLAKSSEPAQTIDSKKAQTDKAPTLQFKDLRDSSTTDDITVNWDLTTRGPQIISGNIQIATPRPPALTPEEIVHNTQPHPWLRRAELLALRFIPTEDGNYRATTLARSYIEQGASRHRAVARAEVIASYNPQSDTLEGEISLFLDYDEDQLTAPLEIQSLMPGSFQFGLRTTFGNPPATSETLESP